MNSLKIVSADDIPFTRWKNGGGLARDLLAWPRPHDWLVRVSVADILDDGPFSPYPGIDRWFGLLSGDGVELQWTKAVRRMDRGRKLLHFDGALAPSCRLDGGLVRAFNVMGRRGRARLSVKPAADGSRAPEGFRWAALFVREPAELGSGQDLRVPAWSLAWGERTDSPVRLAPGAHAWWLGFDGEAAT